MALSAGSVEIRLFAELARLQSDMKKANKVVEDAMGGIQKTVRATTSLFNTMAGAFSAGQIIKLADDYKRFDSQLKLSTKSLREYGEAYTNVIRIGRTAQSDIGAIGVLYARLNNNLRDFNVTQNQVASVTETISLALRTNNATVQETNSVMLQLSQSFGSGKLNGQEFLAVAEGAPMLLRQLANSLKVPFGALKDLSAQGKITREDLLKAWSDPAYLAGLREQVKEVGTVTSSITVLMNNLKQYIGEADKSTSATKTLSLGIMLLADSINVLVSGALAYGAIAFIKWTQTQYAALQASQAATAQKVIAAKVELSLAQAAYASGAAVTKQTAAMANNAAATTMATSNTARLAAAQRGLAVATSTTAAAVRGFGTVLSLFGGWIGLAITGVILFADKLLALYDRVRGLTPEIKALNDEMERRNRLENVGVNASSKSAEQEEALVGQVKLYNEINSQIVRQKSLIDSRKGFGLNVDKETKALAELEKRLRAQSSLMGTNLSQANALTPAISENADAFGKLSEKLQTAKELAAEYSRNQALIIIEGSKLGLSQSEITAKLAILKDQYDKATGATKASKEATKDATAAEKERAEAIKQLVLEQKSFVEAQEDARNVVILDAAQENDALAKQIEKTQERIDLLNMGEDAQNRMAEARLQDAIATAEQNVQQAINNGATVDAIKYAEDYLFALKERLDLQKKLSKVESEEERIKVIEAAEKERVKESKRANDEIEVANDRMYKNLAKSITDSVVRGFENGIPFIENFKNAIKNAFKSFFVSVGVNFVQGALQQVFGNATKGILGSVAGLFSGGAMAGESGSSGSIFSQAKDLFNVVTRGFDSANIAFEQGIQQFGTWITNFGGVGESLGGAIAQYSGAIASALPYTGAVLKLLQGDIKGAAFTGAGTLVGSLIGGPIGGAIGSFLGGALGGLFGGGTPRPKYFADTRVSESGGTLIRGWKNGDGKRSVLNQTNQMFTGSAQSISDFSKLLGGKIANAFQVSMTYNQKHNLYGINVGRGTTKGEWDVYGAKGDLQGATVNAFLLAIKKGFIELPKYMTDALNRGGSGIDAVESLMAIRNMYESLDTLPEVFDAVKYSITNFAMATKESVAALQVQMQGISVYTDLFYTDAEKLNTFTDQLEKQFALLNLTLPDSRDGFRSLVDGIKVVDAATNAQFNGLIALAPAVDAYFKQTQAYNDQLQKEAELKKQLLTLDQSRFRTFTDFVIAQSYVNAGQPIPAANMPSYDVGTSYVPNDGTAMLHRGEAVLTRIENNAITFNSAKMVTLLGELVTKVSDLEYDVRRTADSTQRTARELEDMTSGSVAITTQAA
jgi:tape measure domain-containing protein